MLVNLLNILIRKYKISYVNGALLNSVLFIHGNIRNAVRSSTKSLGITVKSELLRLLLSIMTACGR